MDAITYTTRRTNRSKHLEKKLKPPEEIAVEKVAKVILIKQAKKEYRKYRDRQLDDFIDRMIESAQERGLATWFARELGIESCVVQRWWKMSREMEEVPYKKSSISSDPQSSFSDDHNGFLRNLVYDDPPPASCG
ncbi:uncharacterized protein BX663DRAFT_561541 [Cokeromyces recurvatus]|uniref:uncharacterized protein n=1 Tax=Cokeromyces recurvatus TaxID=90255 RepID=UPI00222027F1|nr:uncharacterized protein BX663DRAFT_561541 [Cokeromyces recurvatus]KAI7902443.1 hypothetical protein BX663DRAFT_561541 [Cokeromyces recurvatus]